MAKFGRRSKKQLATCHPDLQMILNSAIKFVDFSVLEGHRGEELQNKYYHEGRSKLKFPRGKHNQSPSLAVDIAPYPIDWKDLNRFGAVAFFIKGVAASKGIKLRLGADWNGDFKFNENFLDLPHIELSSKLIDGQWVRY
jgi:peptidoglycan LD-endopeptidase CwlK